MKKSFSSLTVLLVLSLVLSLASSSTLANRWWNHSRSDLVSTLEKKGYTTLVAAIDAAGLTDTVANGGPFTILAPSNEAFAKLASDAGVDVVDLLGLPNLREILLYHVLDGKKRFGSIQYETTPESLLGLQLLVVRDRWQNFVKSEVGEDARVIKRNIRASNGYIHAIDKVLLFNTEDDKDGFPVATGYTLENIVDILRFDGRFGILTTALDVVTLEGTPLSDVLASSGPFTLFAPTDEAFAELLEALGATPGDLLARSDILQILLYHVLGDEFRALRLFFERNVPTLEGSDVQIRWRRFGLRVNDSYVESPNMKADNGIIHGVDGVLLP
jgi:uncharacterized surface protein with fasciclin (FAS1) repeats